MCRDITLLCKLAATCWAVSYAATGADVYYGLFTMIAMDVDVNIHSYSTWIPDKHAPGSKQCTSQQQGSQSKDDAMVKRHILSCMPCN